MRSLTSIIALTTIALFACGEADPGVWQEGGHFTLDCPTTMAERLTEDHSLEAIPGVAAKPDVADKIKTDSAARTVGLTLGSAPSCYRPLVVGKQIVRVVSPTIKLANVRLAVTPPRLLDEHRLRLPYSTTPTVTLEGGAHVFSFDPTRGEALSLHSGASGAEVVEMALMLGVTSAPGGKFYLVNWEVHLGHDPTGPPTHALTIRLYRQVTVE